MPTSVTLQRSARDLLKTREMEALLLVLLDEFNRLRQRAGMPQVTKQDLVAALKAKLRSIT